MYESPDVTTSMNTHPQKRILPSRSGRGGPGVGNCDTDNLILETKRRQFESEPLIPGETKFFLTTNPNVASASSSSCTAVKLNVLAFERYFDRPEVLKSYREQKIIETPDFVSLGDVLPNAGRSRARSQGGNVEDSPQETSDVVFEKRHRKYEAFEKRQRLREKEKLKHEQYKLKERIEQLRIMDSAAFLTLPASLFPIPSANKSDIRQDALDDHGDEGERRRKEMLDIAYMLEERYRVLLPRERGKKTVVLPVLDTSDAQNALHSGKGRHEPEPEEDAHKEVERPALKIKLSNRSSLSTHTTELYSKRGRRPYKPTSLRDDSDQLETISPEETGKLSQASQSERSELEGDDRLEYAGSPETTILESAIRSEGSIRSEETDLAANRDEGSPLVGPVAPIPPLVNSSLPAPSSPPPPCTWSAPRQDSTPATTMSSPEILIVQPESGFDVADNGEDNLAESPGRPHKRTKTSSQQTLSLDAIRDMSLLPITAISAPTRRARPPKQSVEYTTSSGEKRRTCSALLISAIRSSGSSSRKGKRHLTAFGVKLQSELFDGYMDFELPVWIQINEVDKSMRHAPATSNAGVHR